MGNLILGLVIGLNLGFIVTAIITINAINEMQDENYELRKQIINILYEENK